VTICAVRISGFAKVEPPAKPKMPKPDINIILDLIFKRFVFKFAPTRHQSIYIIRDGYVCISNINIKNVCRKLGMASIQLLKPGFKIGRGGS